QVGGDQIMHPFDGDGMVAAVTFDGSGHAHFRNRHVRTPGFVEELEAKRMLYRGQFSLKPGGWLSNAFDMRVKNVANTNVMHWAGRLFALWEGGKPTELDPLSLATKGETNFDSALKEGDTFTAHPRRDCKSGREVGFMYKPDPSADLTRVSFWEFEPEGGGFDGRRLDVELPGFGFYHDFLVTDSFYILSRAPVAISPQRGLEGLLGLRSIGEAIDFDESKVAQLVLVPRDGSDIRYVDLDTHFCTHFGNGYELEDKLVVDFVRAPTLSLIGNSSAQQRPVWEVVELDTLEPNRFTRYEIDLPSQRWEKHELSDQHLDYPSINPAFSSNPAYRYTWCGISAMNGRTGPLQGLAKVDVTGAEATEMWLPPEEEFLGEVVFSPREGATAEDDGYLLGFSAKGDRSSDLLIFDAKTIQKGPICRLPVPAFLPHGLHGCFVPSLVPSFDDIEEAWKKTPTSL
ncbi:15'-oxygenase (ACO) (8'-apo-beta-carotenal 15, partial [Durusdinium trenchii]